MQSRCTKMGTFPGARVSTERKETKEESVVWGAGGVGGEGHPGAGRGGGGAGTCAHHARVLAVLAVVLSPACVRAALQRVLGAGAAHVVQQDGAPARPEAAASRGAESSAAAQQATHDARILDAPVVVAHGAPLALVPHLHAALAASAPAYQAHGQVCGERRPGVRQGEGALLAGSNWASLGSPDTLCLVRGKAALG